MRVAQPGTPSGAPGSASERRAALLNRGQLIAIAFMAGVTWLALIGGVIGWSIVGQTATLILTSAVQRTAGTTTYAVNQVVPTRFGSLLVTDVNLGTAEPSEADASPDAPRAPSDTVQLRLALNVSNDQDGPMWSPSVEEFRVVSSRGAEAQPVGRLWKGSASLYPHTTSSMQLGFLAPRDGSDLWLEFRASPAEAPIRIALGRD